MDFRQLYYTSCRSGLSEYAGYQFNAVTPGVSAEDMNEVEALSSYEPPGTLGHAPTPAQIEECPVNLCFVPGPKPIVANVVFTGTDYSGRFGNYFAHALVPYQGGVWQGPPPIELWRARLWTRETVTDPDLPPVPSPLPTGPLSRAVIDDFLDRTAGRARLPALLAAAERAVLDGERSVVILAADADEVARWIAAVSFLLPPPLVARMSFATYQFRPSYSRHHVIGTVPGTELTPDGRAFDSFYLFDFTAGAASEIPVGPLPHLLAAAGTVAAESLWRQATGLAIGDELRLADWYPAAVAAALLDGRAGIGPDDLDVVCAWLGAQAPRLGGDTIGRIGAVVLGHDAVSTTHLIGLANAAAAGGFDELLATVEERLVTAQLADTSAVTAVPLRSPRARELARREHTRALADAGEATVLRLLDLARAHDVRPDAGVLRDCGTRMVGPLLLRSPSAAGVHEALKHWPDLRAGTLAYLDQAAAGATPLYAVFDAGLDRAIPEAELAALPALREAALVAAARREPERRVETALTVLSGRGPVGRFDDALLAVLWPDGWPIEDATSLLSRLPEQAADDQLLVPWVTPLLRGPLSEDRLGSYGALCDLLDRLPLAERLPVELRDRLAAVAATRQVESRFIRACANGRAKERLAEGEAFLDTYHAPATSAARDYLRIRLTALLPTLPHDVSAVLLVRAPDEIRHAYVARVARTLDENGEVAVSAAAAAFATMCAAARLKQGGSVADAIHGVLVQRLPDWRKRELGAVERQVRRRSNRIAEEFKRWRLEHGPRRRGWLTGWPTRN